MIVAELERALLARYPKTDAESWDHVGLSVGDPAAEITGVACALDATEANVRRAQEAGANVLLTHHPIYIKAPEAFCPADATRPQCSAALYEAARCGVSIISLHTNLDRSHEARVCLSKLLGAAPVSSLEHVDGPEATGLGRLQRSTTRARCAILPPVLPRPSAATRVCGAKPIARAAPSPFWAAPWATLESSPSPRARTLS